MSSLHIAVLGRSHVHLPDHLAAVHRIGLSWTSSPREADAVIAGGSPADRERLLPELAGLQMPVLAEKPLARTAEATATLLRGSQGLVTTAMFLRCSAVFAQLKQLLSAGGIGEIASVHAVFSHPGWWDGVFTGPTSWMRQDASLPGGGLSDLAVHVLDALLWMEPAWPLRVRGAVGTRLQGQGPVVAGSALLQWGDAPVTLHAGWTSRPGQLRMAVEGSQGRATIEGGNLTWDAGSGRHIVYTGPAPAAGDAVDAFIQHIRGGEMPLPETADIMRCAVLTDALAAAVT